MVTVFRYGRDGTPKGIVKYTEGTHEETLEGVDELRMTAVGSVKKGDRLLWKDATNDWHEHVVQSYRRYNTGDLVFTELVAVSSVVELSGLLCTGTRLKGTAKSILKKLLSGTRWSAGAVDAFGSEKFDLEVWHKTRRQALADLVETCGGEMRVIVEVGDYGVSKRSIRIREQRGSRNVDRQFVYGRNMTSAVREVGATDPVTAVVAYGETLRNIKEKENREAGRSGKLPAAKDYDERLTVTVKDDSLVERWGTPGKNGKMGHTYAVYMDSGCTDKAFLRQQAKRTLRNMKRADASYEFELEDLDVGAFVRLGDDVSIVDEELSDLERIDRITGIRRNLLDGVGGTVRVGKRADVLVEKFKEERKASQVTTGGTTTTHESQVARASAGGAGGDGWVHQVNGVEQASGTINFTTVGGGS